MAGRDADAEDVVQEMWHRASSRLPMFQWQSALPTWLTAIAINCARERLRVRPIVVAPADSADELPASPSHRTIPLGLDLERAIAQLPDRCRAVLVLHDVEGYTHTEIAARLDIAVGTSKSHLFHARRQLRASFSAAAPARAERHAR